MYIICLHVTKSKQISKIVGVTSFQRINWIIKYADFQCNIFNSPFEALFAEHERTKVAKRLGEGVIRCEATETEGSLLKNS